MMWHFFVAARLGDVGDRITINWRSARDHWELNMQKTLGELYGTAAEQFAHMVVVKLSTQDSGEEQFTKCESLLHEMKFEIKFESL